MTRAIRLEEVGVDLLLAVCVSCLVTCGKEEYVPALRELWQQIKEER